MIRRIVLTADEGKIITDGENYARTFNIPETVDENKYYEITEDEYNAMKAEDIEEINEDTEETGE